jgi:hypothetical protein
MLAGEGAVVVVEVCDPPVALELELGLDVRCEAAGAGAELVRLGAGAVAVGVVVVALGVVVVRLGVVVVRLGVVRVPVGAVGPGDATAGVATTNRVVEEPVVWLLAVADPEVADADVPDPAAPEPPEPVAVPFSTAVSWSRAAVRLCCA